MRKILSAILTLSLAATAALSLPASAASYTTDENVTFSWDMPVSADSSLEHPGLWYSIAGNFGTRALGGNITASDSSDGMRSFHVKAETTDGVTKTDAAFANRSVGLWDSVTLAGGDASWVNSYFVYGDVKMSNDFIGSVFVTFIPVGGPSYGKVAADNSKGEIMLFDNTDDGYYKTRHNNENNGGIKTPHSRITLGTDSPDVFTEWTRVNSLEYDEGYKFSSRLNNLLADNTGISVQVFCLSGEVWVDNIGIWNYHVSQFVEESTVFYNKVPLPDYTDNRQPKTEDGGYTITDMETTVPSHGTLDDGISFDLDAYEKFVGEKSLKVKFDATCTNNNPIYVDIPAETMETLDISTKYHLELAVKGNKNAKVNIVSVFNENDRTSLNQMNFSAYNGEWLITGIGSYTRTQTFVVPNYWDIYSTPSFGVTGGKLRVQLYLRGAEGTEVWIDNIRLVPDRTETVHGKVYGKFNAETQKYTVTAVAEPGYALESLAIKAYNSFEPSIADKTNVLTTVYEAYSLSKDKVDGGDLYVRKEVGNADVWQWPTVNAVFTVCDDPSLGDVNTDGDVNILDIVKLKKYLSKSITDFSTVNLYNANLTNAVVDKDGDFEIDTADMAALRKYLLTNSLS